MYHRIPKSNIILPGLYQSIETVKMSNEYYRRHVHFQDDFSPSAFQLKMVLGPHGRPTLIIKIMIDFEPGRMPKIRVRTKRPREKHARRY